jgi:GDP-4-dehydro-6-deoxy-D-mannose reductase
VRAEAPDAVVLHAGSGEQYGPVPEERLPVTEDEPLRPQNPYAVSKSAADLLAGFYADAHGMRVIRTRAFNHAGPGQSDSYVVAAFARQIAEAERAGRSELVLETGNLAPRRDFCDVRDVVRAYWLAAERGEAAIFNVCSGVSRPVADILAGLARLTEVAVEQRTDPARLRQHEVMDIRGSHARLTEATGWQPEIALEQTLADTLDWWRANG